MPAPVWESYHRATYFSASAVQSTLPSGVAENDLLVVVLYWYEDPVTNQAPSPPSGWSYLGSFDESDDPGFGNLFGFRAYYRLAGSSEPTNTEFDLTGSSGAIEVITIRISGPHLTTPMGATAADGDYSGDVVHIPGVTSTTADNLRVIMVLGDFIPGGIADLSGPPPTEVYDLDSSNMRAWTENIASASAASAYTPAAAGARPRHAFTFLVQPPAAGASNAPRAKYYNQRRAA